VTGASGFLAGHVIKQLLEQGFKVRGTVRHLNDTAKVAHLLEQFPGIELREADLLDDGAFSSVFAGCRFVVHTASPYTFQVANNQTDLVEPAVLGTLNVLRCARRTKSVKRVVVTSSTAAILPFTPPTDVSRAWNEDSWNLDTAITDNAYRYSKSLAEQSAWMWMTSCHNSHSYGCGGAFSSPEEVKDALDAGGQIYTVGFDLVVMNPSLMIGPSLSDRVDGTSTKIVKRILEGTARGGVALGVVDVRDAAAAHVRAMLSPEAFGRYMLSSEEAVSEMDMANMLRADPDISAQASLPDHAEEATTYRPRYNTGKARNGLDMVLRPVAESVLDAARCLLHRGLVGKEEVAAASP